MPAHVTPRQREAPYPLPERLEVCIAAPEQRRGHDGTMVAQAPRNCLPGTDGWSRPRALYGLLIAANVAAWAWAWEAFADRPALLGTALLAWVFGLRHAVDADHIAAIDNVVRKLMQDGKRPIDAGFFFSLGHSTVVVIASAGIAATTAAMQDRMQAFKAVGGAIGTLVSAVFLLLIALVNLVILRGVWRGFRHVARGGTLDAGELGRDPDGRRYPGAIVPPAVPLRHRQLAHVSAGFSVRSGLRHRDRGRAARYCRDAGGTGHVAVADAGVSGPVHRRDGAGGHGRLRSDGGRLWVGVRPAITEAVV
jgi:hypothetical protein